MKRFLPLILGISLSISAGIVIESCNDSMATSKEPLAEVREVPKIETVNKLEKLGFNRSITVATLKNDMEKEKFQKMGLKYLSDMDVDSFLIENNFVIGPASNYIGTVPEGAASEIFRIHELMMSMITVEYRDPYGRYWTDSTMQAANLPMSDINWIKSTGEATGKNVLVIGALEKFDQRGMQVDQFRHLTNDPAGRDPIAVVKIRGGYIELARW